MPKLTDRMKEAIRLKDEEQRDFKEIGQILGIKADSAKNTYHRGKRLLREAESTLGDIPELTNVDPETLAEMAENRAARILQSIDDVTIQGASLYQRATSFSALIDKARLLRGEATNIVSIEDKRKIEQLLPALVNEAKRRGFALDGLILEGEAVEIT